MTRDDVKKYVRLYTRAAGPVKYYLADFRISQRFSADEENPLAVPICGGDRTVPEFQTDQVTPRNPFPTDIYYMGNLVRRHFMQVRDRLCEYEVSLTRLTI